MSFRNDRDADQARIEALEAELLVAQRRIDELEGRSTALVPTQQALVVASPGGRKPPWYGAPMRLERVRTFPGEYPRDDLEELVEVIRELTRDPGRIELLKSSMTWRAGTNARALGPFTVVSVSIRDGRTTVTATDSLGQLAGGLYGGLMGGVGGGGIALPIVAALAVPAAIPLALAVWIGGSFFGTRALFKRAARKRATQLNVLFEAICAHVDDRIASAPAPDAG